MTNLCRNNFPEYKFLQIKKIAQFIALVMAIFEFDDFIFLRKWLLQFNVRLVLNSSIEQEFQHLAIFLTQEYICAHFRRQKEVSRF